MNMLQEEHQPAATARERKERWLPLLEQELKHRVGWADEAVSPFARHQRAIQTSTEVRQAA